MIKYGMTSTVLGFKDKYYEYDGKVEAMHKGLTIGGYESAWLADLAVSYLFQQHITMLISKTLYSQESIVMTESSYSTESIV